VTENRPTKVRIFKTRYLTDWITEWYEPTGVRRRVYSDTWEEALWNAWQVLGHE
jgi:hypothetical protein